MATEMFEVELHSLQNCTTMNIEGNTIRIGFQLMVPQDVGESISFT